MTDVISIGYVARPQFIEFHKRKKRWTIGVAHRRDGKTVAAVADLIDAALRFDKFPDGRFAYVAPTYVQAKDIAWHYLKKYSAPIPGVQFNESELRADYPNGGRVRLYGTENYDRQRGIYLDGLVNDEYGDQDPRAWPEVYRPALSDRKGWATFIGTPKGQNHFFDLWNEAQASDDWFKFLHKASQTGMLDAEELADARKQMSPEQYAAEYECSFYGSVVGSYYGQEIKWLEDQGYIGAYPWEPNTAVNTAWDVGGTTAIWFFQKVDGLIRIIDFLEGHNQSAAWYVNKIRERPYTYGTHILPWDADTEKEIIAISWKDTLAKLGLHNTHLLPQQAAKNNGINTSKLLLPKCRFNEATTKEGLKALRNYRREWDDKRKVFKEHPLHDWSSHTADSFIHLSLGEPSCGTSEMWGKKIEYRNPVYA